MRTVNLKQFQRNMFDEIHDLPVLVVRKQSRYDKVGEPMFVVYPAPKTPPKKKYFIDELIGHD